MNFRFLTRCPQHRSLHAFTLLELLVVIAILAMTATVAFRATSNLADQARLEKTQQTVEQVRQAIIGKSGGIQSDGTPLVSGFVADIGRLPLPVLATIGTNDYSTLNELTAQSPYAYPYGLYQAVSPNITNDANVDATVFVPCGWRGPYIKLASGLPSIYDGWGKVIANPNPLLAYTPNLYTFLGGGAQNTNYPTGYAPVQSTTDPIAGIVVEGPTYRENPLANTFDRDRVQLLIDANEITSQLQITSSVVSIANYENSVNLAANTTATITIRVYGPNPNAIAGLALPLLAYSTNQVFSAPATGTLAIPGFTVTFPSLPPGPKIVRATYVRSGSTGITNSTAPAAFTLVAGFNAFSIKVPGK